MATKQKIDEEELEEDAEQPTVDPIAAAKKKKLMLLGGIGALLLLLAGGGTWFALHLFSKPAAEVTVAASEDKKPEKAEQKVATAEAKVAFYESLDPPFLANYSIGGRQHYLQVGISALAREQADADALRKHMPLVRNRIVMLLSGESFEQLQSDDGRVQLQQKLLTAIQEILKKETGKPGIEQVFFTNFVVQ